MNVAYPAEQGGFHVYGIAFSGRAAESLEEGAKIHSGTIAKFLKQVSKGEIRLNSRSIIVMDEAGMTSLDDMAAVLKVVKASGAKLAAVGDTEQTQSVGRGAPLRAMLTEVGSIKMDTILRQGGWQRDATLLMEQCKTGEGLDLYHQHGHVSLLDNAESACNTLIDKWQSRLEKAGAGALDKQILIAHRNESVAQLNHMARERLIALGKLASDGAKINTRNGKLDIRVGERLLFEANSWRVGVKNGSFGTVTAIDGDHLKVQLDNGKQVQFSTQSYRDINYGYAATVHKLQGATVDYAFEYIDGPTWDRHLFLVGSSRHKLGLEIVADKATFGDYAALREVVSRHGLKDYLLEYPSHFALRRGFDETSTSSLAVRAIRGAKDKVTDSLLWLTNYEAYLDRKAAKALDHNVVPADRLAAKLVADFADNRLVIGQQVEAIKSLSETDDALSTRTELQKSIYQTQLANSKLASQIWGNKDGLRIALDRNRVTAKAVEDSISFGVRHDQIKGMADAYRLGQLYDPRGANQVLTDFKQYYGHIVTHFGDRHDKSPFITTVRQQAYAYRFDQAMQSMGEARHADVECVKQYLDLDCEVSLALAEKAQDPLSKQRLYEMSVSRNALANEIIGAQARQADVIAHFDVDLSRVQKHQQSHMARLTIERFASLINQETSPGIARERELLAHRIRTEPKLYGPYVNEFLSDGFKQVNLDNWRYKQRIALAAATPQFKESYRLVRSYFDAARTAKDAWQNAIAKTRAQSVNASTSRLKAQGLSAYRDKLASQLVADMEKHAGALGFDKVDLAKLSQRARHHDYIDRYSHEQNAQVRLRMAHHINQNLKGFGAQVHSRDLIAQVKREAHHYDYLKQVKTAPDQAIREIIRLNERYQQKAQQAASNWRSIKAVKSVNQNSHVIHMAKHLMSQRNEAAQHLMSALKQHDLVNAPIAGINLDMKRLEKAANQYQGQLLVTDYLRTDKANRGKLAYDILQNRSSYHFVFDKGLSFTDLQSDAHQYLTRAQEKGQQIKPITPRWDAEVVSHALRANSEQVYLSLFGEPKKRTSKEWRYDNGLIVTMRGTQAGNWYAFSEGVGGDLIKAIERIEGLSFKDALARGAQMAGLSEFEAQKISYQRAQTTTPKQSDKNGISDQQRKHSAQSIWDSCILATGTLTERYFKEYRGLHHIEGMQIRHLPIGAKWVDYDEHGKAIDKVSKVPASVIALYNAQGEVTGVQRIFLDKETANKATFMDKPKLSKGIVTGSAGIIQEGKLAGRVYLAEGPETGASIALADSDATVLVSMGVHNLKNLGDVIKSYSPKEVVLAGDYDGKDAATRQTTEQALSDLKEQLPDVACSVIYPEPIAGMKKVDFNDVLKTQGIEVLKNTLGMNEDYQRYWQQGKPIAYTPAERFLREEKGLVGANLTDLKYHPGITVDGRSHQAILASISNSFGEQQGIMAFLLDQDAKAISKTVTIGKREDGFVVVQRGHYFNTYVADNLLDAKALSLGREYRDDTILISPNQYHGLNHIYDFMPSSKESYRHIVLCTENASSPTQKALHEKVTVIQSPNDHVKMMPFLIHGSVDQEKYTHASVHDAFMYHHGRTNHAFSSKVSIEAPQIEKRSLKDRAIQAVGLRKRQVEAQTPVIKPDSTFPAQAYIRFTSDEQNLIREYFTACTNLTEQDHYENTIKVADAAYYAADKLKPMAIGLVNHSHNLYDQIKVGNAVSVIQERVMNGEPITKIDALTLIEHIKTPMMDSKTQAEFMALSQLRLKEAMPGNEYELACNEFIQSKSEYINTVMQNQSLAHIPYMPTKENINKIAQGSIDQDALAGMLMDFKKHTTASRLSRSLSYQQSQGRGIGRS